MPDEPCNCDAYDPEHDDHTKAQHTSCGATYRGPDGACGGCHDCISATVRYWRARHQQESGHGA